VVERRSLWWLSLSLARRWVCKDVELLEVTTWGRLWWLKKPKLWQ
jgi:hypothetical protein